MKTVYSVSILALVAIMLTFLLFCVQGYFYPMKFTEEIISVSKEMDVDAALVASVVNVESGFKPDRTSPKGAKGLMQLMPSTAKWLCEGLKIEYEEDKLYQPEYNLKLGTYYLKYLLNNFEKTDTALCAYNAGPNNVKNWLKNSEYSKDAVTLEKIPFEETRNYIIKLNKNLRYYSRKYK